MYKNGIKRILDFCLAFIGLIVLSPVFLIIALAIKLDSKGPVFFRQKRVTQYKKYFNIFKFRTMRTDTPKDVPTHLLGDSACYVTGLGRFLRKTSLDELPQIINILLGQMAVIGPRPALWNQFDLIELRDKYGANDVRPGLTGLAQISGRDELSLEDKAALDGKYVENITFVGDIKLFVGTIFSVLKADGVKDSNLTDEQRCVGNQSSTQQSAD